MQSGIGNRANHYMQQEIQTASREQLLILLYDGAIRFLRTAKKALESREIEKAHHHIVKTERILVEFMCSLDMEIGGEMARNLYNLYEYLHYRLIQANLKKDVTMIEEVMDHLQKLKQTWEEAIRIATREAALQEKSANPEDEEDSPINERALSA